MPTNRRRHNHHQGQQEQQQAQAQHVVASDATSPGRHAGELASINETSSRDPRDVEVAEEDYGAEEEEVDEEEQGFDDEEAEIEDGTGKFYAVAYMGAYSMHMGRTAVRSPPSPSYLSYLRRASH